MQPSVTTDGIEIVDRDGLSIRLNDGAVVALDVRPAAEFGAGHIAGARSVPIGERRKHLKALPADAQVVAFCPGPYCVYADGAVRELGRKGLKAARLEDGYPEGKRAGMPTAVGNRRHLGAA